MRLRIVSTLIVWALFALIGILPCAAVNIIPYPQSVKMTDAVFNKEKIDKVKYVTDNDMPAEAYELQIKKNGIVVKASIYQTSKDMKRFMLFESSALCGALYYFAGAVEMRHKHNIRFNKVLFDRSIWSTFAAAYSKDESILPELFECLQVIKHSILLPDLIVVLDVSYEKAMCRSKKKVVGGEFDNDEQIQFQKKKEFFKHLSKSGYNVLFIDTNNLTVDDVYINFKEIIANYHK